MRRSIGNKRKCGAPRKDLPDFYKWPLEPEFWDFRDIPPEEVQVATFYEYAASCDWIRLFWKRWTNDPFPDWTTTWYSDEFAYTTWDHSHPMPVSAVLSKHCNHGVPRPFSSGVNDVIERLHTTIPKPLLQSAFATILFAIPKFPDPWRQLDKYSKERLKSAFGGSPYPALTVLKPGASLGRLTNPAPGPTVLKFAINWRKRESEVLRCFKNWLGDAYKQYGNVPRSNKQPHRDQPHAYLYLRWLSAWRLHRSGLTFKQAEQALKSQVGHRVHNYPEHDLPFVSEGTWNNFHTRARKHCARIFPYPDTPDLPTIP